MKKLAKLAMAIFLTVLMAACGGGGSSSTETSEVSMPSVSETDNAKATLVVERDKTTFRPATVRGYVVHLSDGKQEVCLEKKKICKVFWNDGAIGFHSVDQSKGISLIFDPESMEVLIAGQPINATGGNFSFLTEDGKEYALITDAKWLKITAGEGMTVERKENGLIYSSSTQQPPEIVQPPVQVQCQKTKVEINTVTGEVKVTPYIAGDKISNLVNPVVNEVVLNSDGGVKAGYRIAWNDVNSWYPDAGTLASLAIPSTAIAGAARTSGAGMPYLVRPDGSFIAFNTDPTVCEFFINGVQKNVDMDGLIRY